MGRIEDSYYVGNTYVYKHETDLLNQIESLKEKCYKQQMKLDEMDINCIKMKLELEWAEEKLEKLEKQLSSYKNNPRNSRYQNEETVKIITDTYLKNSKNFMATLEELKSRDVKICDKQLRKILKSLGIYKGRGGDNPATQEFSAI